MTRPGLALVGALMLMGCGGGTHVDGDLGGGAFAAHDAISAPFSQPSAGSSAAILISTRGGVCGVIGDGHAPAGSRSLLLALSDVGSGGITAPTAPGKYTVVGAGADAQAHTAGVSYVDLDQTCAKSKMAVGVSGTVTLTSVSDGSYAGSFDVTFDSGDHVTGEFSTTSCASFADQLEQMTNLPCSS